MAFHLDGARLYNALVAKNQSENDYGNAFDSISICLSKGLGAPVGSVLLGSEEFIHHSRRIRKRIGGGWRQAGLLAGAAIYALENNVDRLAEDHNAAKDMAEFLGQQSWVKNVVAPETNILIFGLNEDMNQDAFIGALGRERNWHQPNGPGQMPHGLSP